MAVKTEEVPVPKLNIFRHEVVLPDEAPADREGFGEFQRGGLSLIGGAAVEERSGACEALVLITDANSARRLAQILRACPMRGSEMGLFELYSVAD